MSMTITERILAQHAGLDEVVPGQLITAKLDLVLANDVTGPVAIQEFTGEMRPLLTWQQEQLRTERPKRSFRRVLFLPLSRI